MALDLCGVVSLDYWIEEVITSGLVWLLRSDAWG